MLERICCEEKEALLLGDLNCDFMKERNKRPLKSIILRSVFSQMINSPTRITKDTATHIDLILTNMPQHITKTSAFESGCSDHCVIGTIRNSNSLRLRPRVTNGRYYKNYNSAKFNKDMKDAPWGQVYNAPDIHTAYSKFECIVAGYVEKNAPIIQRRCKGYNVHGELRIYCL